MSSIAVPQQDAVASSRLYRAVWRWHFYAGLYVIPFLMMLAVPGLIILWFTAIAPEYGGQPTVPKGGTALSIPAQADAALAVHPGGKIGIYIAPYGPDNPALFQVNLSEGNRMLAVDPYTGYPLAGKAMAVGIALHEGQMGWWNIALNMAYCLSILLICVSGILMWGKRRPVGELGSPRYPGDYRVPKSVLAIGLLASAAFPLGGLAIVAFVIIDFLLPKRLKEASFQNVRATRESQPHDQAIVVCQRLSAGLCRRCLRKPGP